MLLKVRPGKSPRLYRAHPTCPVPFQKLHELRCVKLSFLLTFLLMDAQELEKFYYMLIPAKENTVQ